MPAPKAPEFRRRAVESHGSGVPIAQIAKEVGIAESVFVVGWPRLSV